MEKQTFEKLISDQPQDVKAVGIIRYNALIATMKAYQDEPTAARDRDWRAAKESFDAFVRTLRPEDNDRFDNLADALAYLKDEGWRAAQTSIYRHQKEGKVRPRPDGSYWKSDIDKYARTFLRQAATGQRVSERIEDLQRKKLEKELQNLKIEIERKQFALGRDQGKYIPKDQMDIELAGRAGILEAGLKHWIQSHAADWIRLTGGDTKKVGELIHSMIYGLDEHLNEFAGVREYRIVIEAEEEETEQNNEEGGQ